jgi:hypothetical protein
VTLFESRENRADDRRRIEFDENDVVRSVSHVDESG